MDEKIDIACVLHNIAFLQLLAPIRPNLNIAGYMNGAKKRKKKMDVTFYDFAGASVLQLFRDPHLLSNKSCAFFRGATVLFELG